MPQWKAFLILIIILGAILAGIFIARQFYTPASPNRLVYNNFLFEKKANNIWYTQWQNKGQLYELGFRYNPKETETVPVKGRLNDTFKRQPFYVTFDPDENQSSFQYLALGVAELMLPIVRAMKGQVVSACTKNITQACSAVPIVTCDNDDLAVIYVRTAEEARVTLDGNCLILEGKAIELLKAIDRVLYHFMNIMP